MNPVYQVPEDQPSLILLGSKALAAALSLAASTGLLQNSSERIAADLHNLTGSPESPADGKQGILQLKREAVNQAIALRQQSIADGLEFCANAIDLLKIRLGRQWNPSWQAAGFTRFTLRLPRNPLTLLLELRAYFIANPKHQLADEEVQITASRADECASAIMNAAQLAAKAETERSVAAEERDLAVDALYKRLTGLRAELKQLLTRDDPRWCRFGFHRPADRRAPGRVAQVTLRPGSASDEVIAEWEPVTGADNYRVIVEEAGAEPVEAGLFTDPAAILRLSSAASGEVAVRVSARNTRGESRALEAKLILPAGQRR